MCNKLQINSAGISNMPTRAGQRVDYDRIAHLYDEPLRDHDPDPDLSEYLLERPQSDVSELVVLDMGCGTGKQLTVNRQIYPNTAMIGLDLFWGMLHQAQTRCATVSWIQADSSATPFADCSFDYATSQFSYSHVVDKNGLFFEAYRILKHAGRYAMTHIDPWSMPDWLVYRYFPAAKRRDFRDFLTVDSFVERMLKAGFTNTVVRRTYHIEKLSLREFRDYALQRYRTSQLMVISDQCYEQGLDALQGDLKQYGDSWNLDSEICLVTITGDKP
jgi:ubiquinone/menaquinone biosynthesis C-methylase UbiE